MGFGSQNVIVLSIAYYQSKYYIAFNHMEANIYICIVIFSSKILQIITAHIVSSFVFYTKGRIVYQMKIVHSGYQS